jgi:Protein of unknown function (DUF2924)
MFGAMPPMALTKDLIARMMIYRVQEEAFGGLDRSTRKLLDGMAQGEKPGSEVKRRLKAGTVLVREYQGQRHTVTVVPDGFVWQGATYGSLSTIARTITGTAWGGPRFFGLRSANSKQEDQEPPNCGLADLDAELEQLLVDAGRSPQRVGFAHAADQITYLRPRLFHALVSGVFVSVRLSCHEAHRGLRHDNASQRVRSRKGRSSKREPDSSP